MELIFVVFVPQSRHSGKVPSSSMIRLGIVNPSTHMGVYATADDGRLFTAGTHDASRRDLGLCPPLGSPTSGSDVSPSHHLDDFACCYDKWWAESDSNTPPKDYESSALTE